MPQTYDYLIAPKASFDATADAIRAKTGSQASITWGQNGFADEIETIGGDYFDLSKPTGVITTSQTTLGDSSAYGRTGITKVIGNSVTRVGGNVFNSCTNLEEVVLPLASANSGMGAYCFRYCSKLKGLVLPSWTQNTYNYFAANCTALQYFDSPTVNLSQGNNFNGDTSLTIVVLRHTSVVPLANISAFTGTPFASGGTGGTLYVPNSLISSYQSATNWSTILGYTNNQIKSIESTHTDPNAPIDLTLYYADGTPIPTT